MERKMGELIGKKSEQKANGQKKIANKRKKKTSAVTNTKNIWLPKYFGCVHSERDRLMFGNDEKKKKVCANIGVRESSEAKSEVKKKNRATERRKKNGFARYWQHIVRPIVFDVTMDYNI